MAPADFEQDWLVANQAFARLLSGDADAALAGYRRAREIVADRETWQQVALDDLEQHPDLWPGAPPIDPAFLAAVPALGNDLPEKPPQ